MKSIRVNTKIIQNMKPWKDLLENYLKHYDDFDGTLMEFLNLKKITSKDKVWIAVRLLPREVLEVFALDMAFMTADVAKVAINAAVSAADSYDMAYAALNVVMTANGAINVAVNAAITADATDAYAAIDTAAYTAHIAAADKAAAAAHAAWDSAVESIRHLVGKDKLL